MSFASTIDLADRIRGTVNSVQGQSVLVGATDELVAACPGWQLTEVVDDTVDLQGSGSASLVLPMPPITSVASVVDGDGAAVTGFTLKSTVVDRQRQDRIELVSGSWDAGTVYTVTYTHGYDDATRPALLRELCLRLAVRMWVNPEQVMQKRRGDYSASFGSSAIESSGLNRYELRMLAKAGLRRSAS